MPDQKTPPPVFILSYAAGIMKTQIGNKIYAYFATDRDYSNARTLSRVSPGRCLQFLRQLEIAYKTP